MTSVFLFASAFLASAVEMVEALTIVLAVGVTRGWRSTLIGVGARGIVLAVIVAVLGPALDADPDRRAAARRRRAAARVRAPVAAQGDPARERLQGAARRGRDLPPRSARRRRPPARRRTRRARLVRVHGRVQGRAARGPRGRVHRHHVRQHAGSASRSQPPGPPSRSCSSSSSACSSAAPLARVPENTMKFAVGADAHDASASSGAPRAPEPTGPAATLSLLGVLAFVVLVSFVLVRALRKRRGPARGGAEHEPRRRVRPLLVGLHRRRRPARGRGRRGRDRNHRSNRSNRSRGVVVPPAGDRGRTRALAAASTTTKAGG